MRFLFSTVGTLLIFAGTSYSQTKALVAELNLNSGEDSHPEDNQAIQSVTVGP